jgi:hypothetical protein
VLRSVPERPHDCEPAWFSRHGTLAATTEAFIRNSVAGFAEELSEIPHVGAQNVLRQLVQQKRIARELISSLFLYTSIDPATRRRQRLTCRSNQSIPTVVDASRLEVSPDGTKAAIILFCSLLDDCSTVCWTSNSAVYTPVWNR